MRVADHVRLFCLATTAWTLFYLGGLGSDYYQTWPLSWLVVASLAFIPVLAWAGPGLIRMTREPPMRGALWVASYLMWPLTLYDFLVLRVHEGQDWSYLWRYWYLTGFNLIPPVVLPLVALRLGKAPLKGSRKAS